MVGLRLFASTAMLFVLGVRGVLADEVAKRPAGTPPNANQPVDAPKPKSAHSAFTTVEDLVAAVRKSVVEVSYSGRNGRREGLGTGFIVSPDGLIATNLHVIGEARPIKVKLVDGKEYDVISIHATERSMDLAVLRIEAKNLPALQLGDSDTLKQGQQVVAIGNPLGFRHSVVSGVVSGRREIDGKPLIQLAIPIERGNSGGPLLDMHGRVHGILTLKSLVTENLGFAVAVNALKPLLKKPNPTPISRWLTIGALDPREWTPLFGARWRQRAGRILVDGQGQGFGGRSLIVSEQDVPELPFEVAVSVRLKQNDGAAGLVFHSNGKEKHYGFYPSSGNIRLSRFDGPDVYSWKVLKTLNSRHYRPGEWNRLKVRVEEHKIQCFLNDQLVIESTDSRYTAGKVGLAKFRHTEAEFKGFQIAKTIPSRRPSPETVARITALVADIAPDRPPDAKLAEELLADAHAGSIVLRERAQRLEQQARRLRELADAVNLKKTQAQLLKLLENEEPKIDLLHAALLIARLDNDELSVEAYFPEVDRMVRELSKMFPKDADDSAKLKGLNKYLFEELGFHGSRNDYYNRSNSYLNEVIDDREGLPITLSVLYMELARRVGLKVVGVGLPGHFVVRYEPKQGAGQLIDVFDKGKLLTRAEANEKVKSMTGRPLTDEHLKAQPKRAILIRMLANLMSVARNAKDLEAMLRYVDTMVAIAPESPQERWFRAVLRFQTDRFEEAIQDTDWLLERNPEGINLDLDLVRRLRRDLETARKK